MTRLQGKVAVITGANSGIGYATAQEFIANGAKVIITGRNKESVEKAAAELGHGTVGIVSDAGNLADVKQLAEKVKAVSPTIDVLFVNAGIAKFAPANAVDEAHFDEHFNINVKGLFFTVQTLLPLINKGGSIILNASVVAHKGYPNASIYSATKAAVVSLGKTLAQDLLQYNVRVNTISPGPIETTILSKTGLSAAEVSGYKDSLSQTVPLKRLGQASEIAQAAVFFASDESSYVLGSELLVDGGISFV